MRQLLAVVLTALACIGCAQEEPANLVLNGGFTNQMEEWSVPQSPACMAKVTDAKVGPCVKALQLTVRPEPGSQPHSIVLNQKVDERLIQGEPLVLSFWARSPQSNRINAYVELSRDPYTKTVGQAVALTPEWKEYVLSGKAVQDYKAGDAQVVFHLGFAPGVIELTGIRLYNPEARPVPGRERPTVDQPVSMVDNGDFSEPLEGNWGMGDGQKLQVTLVSTEVTGYPKGLRLVASPPPDSQGWSVGFGQRCKAGVRKGDAVYFRAWMRSPDKVRVTFVWEMAEAPNTKGISQMVRLTPEWKEYRFLGRAFQSFGPDETQAKWFLGHDKGTVELAGVRVENYGPATDHAFSETIDYWGGRENPDTWRAPALERIERIRKGDLTVRVRDLAGAIVPDAVVKVDQQRHYFRFGSAVPASRLLDTVNPDNLRFQEEVARLFNTVTFENDLKWPAIGDGSLSTVNRAVDWLKAHDIDVRGHCLLWGSYKHLPPALRELRGDELLAACKAHVADYATRMRGKVYLWDVVNEAGSNVEVWDSIGWESFADSFRWARAADPDVRLCYNDYGIIDERPEYRAKVAQRVRYLLDHGAPVDALGIQGHMHSPLTPIVRVLEILDEWAAFGKDLEITEYDVGLRDDQMHAEYTRDILTAAFSHPSVKSFIMWGFWEGSHWRARDGGAMVRRDWSNRPASDIYQDLVFHQWWTHWQGKTNAAGDTTLRAFYGRHQVTVEAQGKTVTATINLVPGGDGMVEVRIP